MLVINDIDFMSCLKAFLLNKSIKNNSNIIQVKLYNDSITKIKMLPVSNDFKNRAIVTTLYKFYEINF